MNNHETKRQEILEKMGTIKQMEHGRLTEEYREREVDGRVHRTGPYYKHQVWRDGRNVTTRVKAAEVAFLPPCTVTASIPTGTKKTQHEAYQEKICPAPTEKREAPL